MAFIMFIKVRIEILVEILMSFICHSDVWKLDYDVVKRIVIKQLIFPVI